MFQHLAGMFRRRFPFPDNPGRGRALEQCFWQAAAGRQQADPSTPSSCGGSSTPTCAGIGGLRQHVGEGSPRQAGGAHQCRCLTRLWARCAAQDGLEEGWWITTRCALHVLQVCWRVQANEHIICKELPAPT